MLWTFFWTRNRTFPTDIFSWRFVFFVTFVFTWNSFFFYVTLVLREKFVFFVFDNCTSFENLCSVAVLRTTLQCCLTTYDTGAFVCHTNDRTSGHHFTSAVLWNKLVLLDHLHYRCFWTFEQFCHCFSHLSLGVSMTHTDSIQWKVSAELTFWSH